MSDAFRCDNCGEFAEGSPTLQVELSADVNARETGLLGDVFGSSDGSHTLDLCSIACFQNVDFNALSDELLAEVDNKAEILDSESNTVSVEEVDVE